MQPKLIVTYDRLSEPDFLAKAGFIIASLTNNPHYPEPWPAQAPSLAQLNEAYNAYRDAYHASLTRDTVKITQRDTARAKLVGLLKQLAPYLELVAQGDTAILVSTGYDLRKDNTRGVNRGTLPAPADFRLDHGPNSGTVLVHIARLAGAGSYEVQTAQGDPTVEANWKHALSSITSGHILLEGLTPGQTCWVRIRGIGSDGAGVWTDPLSIMVT